MKVSTKVALGLGLVSIGILGTYGFWQYSQEMADLKEAAERDFETLGVTVQVAIENSLRDNQHADVREVLESLEVREPGIDVFVIDQAGNLTTQSPASDQPAESVRRLIADLSAQARHTAAATPVVRFEATAVPPRLVGLLPLRRDGDTAGGAILIVRPLEALADDLERTRNVAIGSSLALIGGITFVGWLLLLTYVRRPLEGLNRALRAVREGDLSGSLEARSNDELGAIAAEFNAMVRELEQARSQLLAAAEAHETLEQALRQVDKLVTVGQLSAGLAHEIGSPLQVLSGRARSLVGRTDLPADVIRTAQILEEQTVRIARIVEQLLTFARRKAPQMVVMDLAPPIRAIVDLLEGEARRRGVRLECHCPDTLPTVTADADQIQQIAMNLVSNALRATPRTGRVRVSLSESAFRSADGLRDQPSVVLTVEDDGHGMSEAVQNRIFEPFFTTWSETGTGLGLAVVKSIVDEHGGTIVVSSAQGLGTRVLVHLPTGGREGAGGFPS